MEQDNQTIDRAAQLLAAGDAAGAEAILLPLVESGAAGTKGLLLLATTYRQLDNAPKQVEALDRLIGINPYHVSARLIRGRLRAANGDPAGASEDFRSAISIANQAAAQGQVPPPPLRTELEEAASWLNEDASQQSRRIEQTLNENGFGEDRRSPLVVETLAILNGEAEIQLQRPKNLYIPGLPQRAFYEREEFAWVAELEAQWQPIRDECASLLACGGQGVEPYLPAGSDRSGGTAPNSHLVGDSSWSAFHLLRDGHPVEGQSSQCPATMAILDGLPLPRIADRAPMALFSLLAPGAHIRPHHGLFNHRLICHLPLIVPEGCSFRVGNHVRDWKAGELLIFDDSVEHEAWNRSGEQRAILIFEIWKPEIGDRDRDAISLILRTSHAASED